MQEILVQKGTHCRLIDVTRPLHSLTLVVSDIAILRQSSAAAPQPATINIFPSNHFIAKNKKNTRLWCDGSIGVKVSSLGNSGSAEDDRQSGLGKPLGKTPDVGQFMEALDCSLCSWDAFVRFDWVLP